MYTLYTEHITPHTRARAHHTHTDTCVNTHVHTNIERYHPTRANTMSIISRYDMPQRAIWLRYTRSRPTKSLMYCSRCVAYSTPCSLVCRLDSNTAHANLRTAPPARCPLRTVASNEALHSNTTRSGSPSRTASCSAFVYSGPARSSMPSHPCQLSTSDSSKIVPYLAAHHNAGPLCCSPTGTNGTFCGGSYPGGV